MVPARQLVMVMGKRRNRATSEDIRRTSFERLPDSKNELSQSETRSNDLHELVEVYRQHSHL